MFRKGTAEHRAFRLLDLKRGIYHAEYARLVKSLETVKAPHRPPRLLSPDQGVCAFVGYLLSLSGGYLDPETYPSTHRFPHQREVVGRPDYYHPLRDVAPTRRRQSHLTTPEKFKTRPHVWMEIMLRCVWFGSTWASKERIEFSGLAAYQDAVANGTVPNEARDNPSAYGTWNYHRSDVHAEKYWNTLATWEDDPRTRQASWTPMSLFKWLTSSETVEFEVNDEVAEAERALDLAREDANQQDVLDRSSINEEEDADEDLPSGRPETRASKGRTGRGKKPAGTKAVTRKTVTKKKQVKIFPGLGDLTAFLIVGDFIGGGCFKDGAFTVEDMGTLVAKVNKGAVQGMQELGVLRQGKVSPAEIRDAYVDFHGKVSDLLTPEQKSLMRFNVTTPENGLCKWQRSDIDPVPEEWLAVVFERPRAEDAMEVD